MTSYLLENHGNVGHCGVSVYKQCRELAS